MNKSESKLRLKRCICKDNWQKRNHPQPWTCTCSARVVRKSILKDLTYKIIPLTPQNLKEQESILDAQLLSKYILETKSSKVKPQVTQPTSTQSSPGQPKIPEAETPAAMATWEDAVQAVANSLPDQCRAKEFDAAFDEFIKTFEYRGFDVEKIRMLLAVRLSKIKSGTKLTIGKDVYSIEAPTCVNLIVCFLVSLFNLRGTNLDSITEGLDGDTKNSFKALCASLALQSKVTVAGKAKSAETLTLGRIAAAFPIHAVVMATGEKVTRKVFNMSDIGLNHDDLGKALMHPMAASVITDDMINVGVVFITFWASFKLNQLIGGKEKAPIERLWLFHKAALMSKAASTAQREALWKKLNVVMDEAVLVSISLAKEQVTKLIKDENLLKEIEEFHR